MAAILIFLTLAVTVEGLVEYVKNLVTSKDKKSSIIQLFALLIAVMLCVMSGADVYAALGVTFGLPYVGCILTGIFASRGANYASDILGRLQKAGDSNATAK